MTEEETEASEGEAAPESGKGWSETVRAVFWAALLALAIRSFVVEPFKIPSGSMIPTLLVGDYVLVNKFAYGLRLPITGTLLFEIGEPQRGDVVVFRYPDDPSQDFIKRVVGIPGDRIEVKSDRVFINGQPLDQIDEGDYIYERISTGQNQRTLRYRERNPDGVEYTVIQAPRESRPHGPIGPWVVPEEMFFMMGDNRDNSADSRRWRNPYVASDQLKGRAFMLHWSWIVASGPQPERGFLGDMFYTLYRVATFQVEVIRWGRIGRSISGVAD